MMKARHKSSQIEVIDIDFIKFIETSPLNFKEVSVFLQVNKKEILAKKEINIIIDKKDYDSKTLVELSDEYIIPGILDILVGEGDKKDTYTLPFNFKVHLIKPDNIIYNGQIITLVYSPGEKILYQDLYIKDNDPMILSRLLDGVTKYITSPEMLFDTVKKELPDTDCVHTELIVSNMLRSIENPTIPGRLVDYHNCQIIGCKKLPFVNSWLSALAFENINKAIKTGLVEHKDATFDPIENVLVEKFYSDEEES